MYNVPLELFSREGLSYIASALGVSLSMDSITASKTRLEYAKVCIEIGAKKEIPKTIKMVLTKGQTTTIFVEVPWYPNSCRKCESFGHSDKSCHVKMTTTPTSSKVWRKKDVLNANLESKSTEGIDVLQEPMPDSSPSKEKFEQPQLDSPTSKEKSEPNILDPDLATESHSSVQIEPFSKGEPSVFPSNFTGEKINVLSHPYTLTEESVKGELSSLAISTIDKEKKITSIPKRGRGRPLKVKSKVALKESAKRFEILSIVYENSPTIEGQVRKVRPVASGVANLLKELNLKKKEHIVKANSSLDRDKWVYPSLIPNDYFASRTSED
ncbi:uncharacterized protein LOC120210140 [Hibiscus syriacus]|uniref:uncharacterized protein LOC120210140 n=1 Tax=Hibiscus syriacus TaxID=106335 RepID=UPI001921229B|nr:uncharacterized protein LOC120210140 [Hibiscus syriacus]